MRGTILLVVAGLAGVTSVAFTSSASAPSAKNRFIGSAKCKRCHDKEEHGDAFAAWSKAKHAHAFEVLATERAKEVAADHGIADAQKADACLRCHVTGHGEPKTQFQRGFKHSEGVGCEVCHGPGERHFKARFAAASKARAGRQELPADEIVRQPEVATCRSCHNAESPTFQDLCFKTEWRKIRHLDPRKARSPEELKALDFPCPDDCVCGENQGDGQASLR